MWTNSRDLKKIIKVWYIVFLSLPKIIKSVYKEKKVKMNNKEKVSISNSTLCSLVCILFMYICPFCFQ